MEKQFEQMTAAELREYAEMVQAEYDADEISGANGRQIVRDAWERVEEAERAELAAALSPRIIANCAQIDYMLQDLAAEAQRIVRRRDHASAARVYRKMVRLARLGAAYEQRAGMTFREMMETAGVR